MLEIDFQAKKFASGCIHPERSFQILSNSFSLLSAKQYASRLHSVGVPKLITFKVRGAQAKHTVIVQPTSKSLKSSLTQGFSLCVNCTHQLSKALNLKAPDSANLKPPFRHCPFFQLVDLVPEFKYNKILFANVQKSAKSLK